MKEFEIIKDGIDNRIKIKNGGVKKDEINNRIKMKELKKDE